MNIILKDTFTLNQLRSRLQLLKSYIDNQLYGGKTVSLSPEETKWLSSLGNDFYKNFTPKETGLIFDDLEKTLPQIPLVTLYLAFEPGETEIAQIGTYLRANFKNIQLFEIKYNPDLIGGAALSYKGTYRDYSLRKKIDDQKQQILASFKEYLR